MILKENMKKSILSLALFVSLSASANCPDLYPPTVKIPVLENTVELCNSFFVSIFDTNNKAVLVSSEHLTDHSSLGSVLRVNAFHADPRVKNSPKPSDYSGTGYDQGHMAPAADSANSDQMRETFLMTNMTPQEPTLNRISWKTLEENTRKQFAKIRGDMYVMNIAIYRPGAHRVGNGIPVPAGYWKIVYTASGTRYFYADNTPHAQVKEVGATDVSKLIKNSQNF